MTSLVKRLSLLAAAVTVAAVFVLPSAVLHGDEFNLLTYITVSQPFQVPGAVLQPNTKYVLRRLNANAGTNHVVRILNEDQTQVISTFFAVPDYRLEPTGDTVLTFMETAAGYPRPVKTWFYPGRIDGLEFIYSKEQRAEIAAHAPGTQKAEVQTAQLTQEENFTPAPVQEAPAIENNIEQNNESEVMREKPSEPEPAVEPAPAPVDENADQDKATDTTAKSETDTTTGKELPHTAGELSLIGLIGLASLGLRQALRRF